jgi:hypothetical protein
MTDEQIYKLIEDADFEEARRQIEARIRAGTSSDRLEGCLAHMDAVDRYASEPEPTI